MNSRESVHQLSINRKADHINNASQAQIKSTVKKNTFSYEPLFATHQTHPKMQRSFLGKTLRAPLWISSMTGGSLKENDDVLLINQNLALLTREFGLGMGLGSIRPLLDHPKDEKIQKQFLLRDIIGDDRPFFANLGIFQLEEQLKIDRGEKLHQILDFLRVDGLFIHINPLQEFYQPEGDMFKTSPLAILQDYMPLKKYPIFIKEVGQGMGKKSLQALMDMQVDGIEFASFGGTSFSRIEQLRREKDRANDGEKYPYALHEIGHTATEMNQFLNEIIASNQAYRDLKMEVIVSGGMNHLVSAYELMESCPFPAIIGKAHDFIIHAKDKNQLFNYTAQVINELNMCYQLLDHP